MAKPNILSIEDGIVTFTLSNKPEHEIKVTEEDYKKHIENETHWYVKEWYKAHPNGGERILNSRYVVRILREKCDGTGKTHYHTWFLHWDIIGQSCHWGDGVVVDHIDRDKLNNIKSNLRIVTYLENQKNSDRVDGTIFKDKYGIKLPEGYNIAILVKGIGRVEHFQCYYKNEYVKCSTKLKVVLDAIERHQKTDMDYAI